MKHFLDKFSDKIKGTKSGFDGIRKYPDSMAALKSGESFDAIIPPLCSLVIYNNPYQLI